MCSLYVARTSLLSVCYCGQWFLLLKWGEKKVFLIRQSGFLQENSILGLASKVVAYSVTHESFPAFYPNLGILEDITNPFVVSRTI